MNFGEVLGKPFKMIWKNPLLWVVALIGQIIPVGLSIAGLIWFLTNPTLMKIFTTTNMITRQSMIQDYIRPLELMGTTKVENIIGNVVIGLMFLFLFSFLIKEYTLSCMVRGVRVLEQGSEKVTFRTLLWEGEKPYGKLLLQDLFWGLLNLVAWGVLIFLFAGMISAKGNTPNWSFVVIILCGSCILLPLVYFLFVFLRTVRVSLIHDNLGVFKSIGQGWRTFKKSFGWLLLLGVIVVIGGGIVSWVISLLFSGIRGVVVLGKDMTGFTPFNPEWLVIEVISSLVSLVVGSFIYVYGFVAWTIAYRQTDALMNKASALPPAVPVEATLPPPPMPVPVKKSRAKKPKTSD